MVVAWQQCWVPPDLGFRSERTSDAHYYGREYYGYYYCLHSFRKPKTRSLHRQ